MRTVLRGAPRTVSPRPKPSSLSTRSAGRPLPPPRGTCAAERPRGGSFGWSGRARGPCGSGDGGGGGQPEGPEEGGGGALRRHRGPRPERPRNGQEGPPRSRCGFRGRRRRRHHQPRPHVCFVPPHALWSLPSPTHPRSPLFLAHPTGSHPGSRSRPAAPIPGARDSRALLSERGQGSSCSQMAHRGFPGIEIAAGSGPLKLLKGRDVKGRVRAHPRPSPTAPPARPGPSADPEEAGSGDEAPPVVCEKPREPEIQKSGADSHPLAHSLLHLWGQPAAALLKPQAQPPAPTRLSQPLCSGLPTASLPPWGKGHESPSFRPGSRQQVGWVALGGSCHGRANCSLSLSLSLSRF